MGIPCATIQNTAGDEGTSEHVNREDQQISQPQNFKADMLSEDEEDMSELEGDKLLESLKVWMEAETEQDGEDGRETTAYAFSCQNFTVSSILLNISGLLKSIFTIIVIIHLFNSLKENMSKALALVNALIIWKWKH